MMPTRVAGVVGLCAVMLLSGLSMGTQCAPTSTEVAVVEEAETLRVHRRVQPMMGTRFEIQVVGADGERASEAIEAAFEEIERTEEEISEWRPSSQISEVNRRGAQQPVDVGERLLEVVRRGLELSEQTGGAFDMTFAGCGHLWSVGERRVPGDRQIEECLPRIGYDEVVVADGKIRLGDSQKLGLGAIGKGYGVDRAAEVLSSKGFENFVVDGGGDMRVEGRRIDRRWSVGVAHPRRGGELLGTVSAESKAVVTSGDYERYFVDDGVRYHHIIDPNTGRPARKSVATTAVADDATTADAAATALFVMGPRKGVEWANETEGIEALIVDPDLSLHRTDGMGEYFHPAVETGGDRR